MLNRVIIEDCIRCLTLNPSVAVRDGRAEELTVRERVYAPEILVLATALAQYGYDDPNYMENMERLRHTPIEQLSLNECMTWLTYIFRGEETVAGHIQFYVENGILLQLLKRLNELLD